MTTRILLVDDHKLLRAGLRTRLEKEPWIEVVGEADSGERAVLLARSLQPDVVLLDLLLPRMDGADAIPEIAAVAPSARVIVISSQTAASSVRRAMTAGASGYLPKHASDVELLTAIRQVSAGSRYVDPELGASLVVENLPSPLEKISERERDVLQLLALGYTNQEIGKRLYISVRTVDSHRAHILRKLQLSSRSELVLFALAHGLIGPS